MIHPAAEPAVIDRPAAQEAAFPEARNLRSRDVFRLLVRAWPFIRPYRNHLIYFFLALLPNLPLGLFLLTMIRVFFDVVGHGAPLGPTEAWMLRLPMDAPRQVVLMHACVATGIVLMIAAPIAAVLLGYAIWILQKISNLFRVNLYTRLQELSVQFHSDEKIGDAIYRMFQDSATIPHVIDGLVLEPIRAVPLILGSIGYLLLYDVPMAVIALIVLPANWILAQCYSAALRRAFIGEREAAAQATTRIEETLSSIKAVKAFGRESSEADLYARDNWNAFIAARSARLMLARYRVWSNVLRGLAYTGALYFGAREVLAGGTSGLLHAAVSLGLFQATLAVFERMSSRLRNTVNTWGAMQDVVVAISRVLEIVGKPPEQVITSGHKIPPHSASMLSFRDVSFGYDVRTPVLQDVSFEARMGELTAIAGASGSGKSTIISLIVRFFDPTSGTIALDGEPINDFALAAWRGMISVGLQENPLFTATLRDNVAYGRPEATVEEVVRALENSGLGDFMRSLPAGLDTMLGEKGAKISTGQAQRIGLARALLRGSSVLLLDEPTSALDVATEELVMRGIREWIAADPHHRMAIVATHRRTTAARADRIYQIAAGRLSRADQSAFDVTAPSEVRDG